MNDYKSIIWKFKNISFIITTDIGNNPMVGMTVAVAVAVEESSK